MSKKNKKISLAFMGFNQFVELFLLKFTAFFLFTFLLFTFFASFSCRLLQIASFLMSVLMIVAQNALISLILGFQLQNILVNLRATSTNVKLIVCNMSIKSGLSDVLPLIKDNHLEEGLHIMSEHLLRECIMLMASHNKQATKYELYALYYDNYLDFVNKVQADKFNFSTDAALKSYFKTGCTHRVKEQQRLMQKPKDWLDESYFEHHIDDIDESFSDSRNSEYAAVLDKYGVDLSLYDSEEDFPSQVIKAFHTLNEKCKFLVVLKYMINLSHKDIVDCLSNFYELKNENVSKTELKRCLDHLKKQSLTS
jgi:hypothetical protein